MAESESAVGDAFGAFAANLGLSIAKLQAQAIIDKLTLKYLIAEVAKDNRSAAQATSFVIDLKSKLDRFVSELGESEGDLDATLKDAMEKEVKLIFTGISFEEI